MSYYATVNIETTDLGVAKVSIEVSHSEDPSAAEIGAYAAEIYAATVAGLNADNTGVDDDS